MKTCLLLMTVGDNNIMFVWVRRSRVLVPVNIIDTATKSKYKQRAHDA